MDDQTKQWALILHLSQFAGYLIPFAGFIAPVVIWQIKKNDLPGIDVHGRHVVNWMISAFIYGLVVALLCLVFVGLLLAPVLLVATIAFPIIGAVKASQGEAWKYPGSLTLIK